MTRRERAGHVVIALLVVCGICLMPVCAAPAPEVEVVRAEQPPRIDGRLDDSCWKGKPQVTEFRCVTEGRPLPTQRTEAWIAYDDDALYVAARCYEDHMDMVQAVETGIDGRVWRDDCLEVFLMPGTPYYYHFAANLLGTRYDARHSIEAGREEPKPESWNAEWSVASQRSKDCWMMEIALPFACMKLGAKNLAAPFRFNLGREQRRLAEFSCWPASEFNKSEEFAVLKGLSLDRRRYGLVLRDASMGERVPGPNEFTATVEEEPVPGSPMTVRASVRALPQGEPATCAAQVVSSPGAPLKLPYQVSIAGGLVSVTVDFLDARGRACVSLHDAFRVPSAIEASLDLPLLYRSDANVRLSGRVAVPAAFRKEAKLRATLVSGEKTFAGMTVPIAVDTGEFHAHLPVARLTAGDYTVETCLIVPGLAREAVLNHFPFRLIAGPFD